MLQNYIFFIKQPCAWDKFLEEVWVDCVLHLSAVDEIIYIVLNDTLDVQCTYSMFLKTTKVSPLGTHLLLLDMIGIKVHLDLLHNKLLFRLEEYLR